MNWNRRQLLQFVAATGIGTTLLYYLKLDVRVVVALGNFLD